MNDLGIKDKLASWGSWSRSFNDGLGYVSPSYLILKGKIAENKEPPKTYFITDDEAVIIDTAIKLLRKRDEVLFQMIKLKYYYCWSAKDIAKNYLTDKEYPHLKHLDWDDKDKKHSDYRHVGMILKEAERIIEEYLL